MVEAWICLWRRGSTCKPSRSRALRRPQRHRFLIEQHRLGTTCVEARVRDVRLPPRFLRQRCSEQKRLLNFPGVVYSPGAAGKLREGIL